MTHEKNDASEKMSTNSSLVARIVCLANVLLPDAALGFSVEDTLKKMKEDGTYASDRWKDWPEKLKPGEEKEMNKFLVKIQSAIYTSLHRIRETKTAKPSAVDMVGSRCPSVNDLTSTTSSPSPDSPAATSLLRPVDMEDVSTHSSSHLRPRRRISCVTHEITSGSKGSKHLPNHAVVKLSVNVLTVHWKDIDAVIELKCIKSDNTLQSAQFQVWQDAKFIFRNQHNRRFVLGVMLLGSIMKFMYIDRSGVLISSIFDINAEPLLFLRVVAGLIYADDKYLGYDTTISVEEGNPTSVTLSGIKHSVKNVVHAETGILGRGTVCLEVSDDLSDSCKQTTYVLKDAWVDVSRAQKEAQILTELNALNVSNIPTLVRHEIVRVDGVEDSTQNIRNIISKERMKLLQAKQNPDISTDAHEHQEQTVEKKQPNAKDVDSEPASVPVAEQTRGADKIIEPKEQNSSNWDKYMYYARDHHRLLMWPFGRSLTAFRCLEELLLGIRDIIRVIQQLESVGCLHRDVGINNVMLAFNDKELADSLKSRGVDCYTSACADVLPCKCNGLNPVEAGVDDIGCKIEGDCKSTASDVPDAAKSNTLLSEDARKRLEGFLIDFDHSIFTAREDSSTLANRTGTIPFMAFELLRSSRHTREHRYYHDLESLFYVLCWVCTVSAGPNIDRPFKEYSDSTIYKWNDEEPTIWGIRFVANSKYCYTRDDKSFGNILKDSHEYFKPIFGCLLGLRKCLFPTIQSDPELLNYIIRSYEELKNEIDKNAVADESQLQELKIRRLRLHLDRRDKDDLFQDLYDVIDEAVDALPPEHKLAALKDLPASEHSKGTATKSRMNKHSTMTCTSEFMDLYIAVWDVLTEMTDFSSKPKSKHAGPKSTLEPASVSALQEASGSIASSRPSPKKRKNYKEEDASTISSRTSGKKLKMGSDFVVRKIKKSLHDKAEFVQ